MVGQQLGNYRLTKRIGSGGFADVYTAEHVVLRQDLVAIKVLRGSWDETLVILSWVLACCTYMRKIGHRANKISIR
jgi:hypothetical protein